MSANKNTARKLNLSRETLRQLSNTELKRAAGGVATSSCNDWPVRRPVATNR